MKLTDRAIKYAAPKDKSYKLSDGHGMYLEVRPTGGRYWMLKYRYAGKEKRISLGAYPKVGLKEARSRREAARQQLEAGTDPSAARKSQKAAALKAQGNSFEIVAREWHEQQRAGGRWVEKKADKVLRTLERDAIPFLGQQPIDQITAPQILAVLRQKEASGAVYSAHRLHQTISQVFRYAVATSRAERDPCPDLRGALQPTKPQHRAALTDPRDFAALLRAIDEYRGSLISQCALRLAPLVFVRPGELRHAEWSELNLDTGLWTIPASKMKMGADHLVPLATQSIEILREVELLTGQGRYVFPSERTSERPMSDNTVLAALRRMGYSRSEMTGHGFRAIARTLLDEQLGYRPDWIEHQLAHTVRDPLGRAYNRTKHLPQRHEMMQAWADYLDQLKAQV